jgi:hypothetical protein
MKPIKAIGILLGMTFTFGGFSGFVSSALAVAACKNKPFGSQKRLFSAQIILQK